MEYTGHEPVTTILLQIALGILLYRLVSSFDDY